MRHVTVTPHMAAKVLRMACPSNSQEERLWGHVLTSAVRDCCKSNSRAECLAFFRSRWFSEVCEMSGVDAGYARSVIRMIGKRMQVDFKALEKGGDNGH